MPPDIAESHGPLAGETACLVLSRQLRDLIEEVADGASRSLNGSALWDLHTCQGLGCLLAGWSWLGTLVPSPCVGSGWSRAGVRLGLLLFRSPGL